MPSGLLIGLLTSVCASLPAQDAPYPPSTFFERIEFDDSTRSRHAQGSDNWVLTWADDDHQYTSFGDGGGFGGSNHRGRASLGIARVEGDHRDPVGVNIAGGHRSLAAEPANGKSYGLIADGASLYMWVSPGSDRQNFTRQTLYHSSDRGLRWHAESWHFDVDDGVMHPAFCQFGRDLSAAPDAYFYVYLVRIRDSRELAVQRPGAIDLARVLRSEVRHRRAYEFFAGLDTSGQPTWTTDLAARQPVFEDPEGVGWTLSVTYAPELGRYLLVTEHTRTFNARLGIFDAPAPWGPWTTVTYGRDSRFGTAFYWNFSPKWFRENGTGFTLVYTGIDAHDSWNQVDGRFVLSASAPLPPDEDGDGVRDASDNCLRVPNAEQSDLDGDGLGDACDEDLDGDGIANLEDVCPYAVDPLQGDDDGDGLGDACETDRDSDGIDDDADNCPDMHDADQSDADGDGLGDACDADRDGDGFENAGDNCPDRANGAQSDLDGDGLGDACDADRDGDGLEDGADNCPDAVHPDQSDLDADGLGDLCDASPEPVPAAGQGAAKGSASNATRRSSGGCSSGTGSPGDSLPLFGLLAVWVLGRLRRRARLSDAPRGDQGASGTHPA